MVTLIEDPIAKKELRSEPYHKLLIINKCPFGVFLSLKIPLYLVEPGFIYYLFSLNIATMCGFVNLLMVIWGASLEDSNQQKK